MPNFEKISIMPHARQRMAERGVSEAEVTSTICEPHRKTFQYAGNHGGRAYLHMKRIGTAELFVSAEIAGKQVYVITVFWK